MSDTPSGPSPAAACEPPEPATAPDGASARTDLQPGDRVYFDGRVVRPFGDGWSVVSAQDDRQYILFNTSLDRVPRAAAEPALSWQQIVDLLTESFLIRFKTHVSEISLRSLVNQFAADWHAEAPGVTAEIERLFGVRLRPDMVARIGIFGRLCRRIAEARCDAAAAWIFGPTERALTAYFQAASSVGNTVAACRAAASLKAMRAIRETWHRDAMATVRNADPEGKLL